MVMYNMAMTALTMNIESEVFWEALFKKLDQENLYRYITLFESAKLLNALLNHPVYRDHSLTKKLITVVHQQKSFYLNYAETRKLMR